MFTLFFNLLKLGLFVCTILMVGQIPVKRKPIAAHLTDSVLELWRKESSRWVEPLEDITEREQASLRRFLERKPE